MEQTLVKSDEVAWADNIDRESEFKDSALVELGFAIDGAWSGGAGTAAQDAALKLLGRLEFNHNGPRISSDPRLLYFLHSFLEGGVRDTSPAQGSTVGATGIFHARFGIPFQRMVPGGGLDALARVAAWKIRTRIGTFLATTSAVIGSTTRIRPTATTSPRAPAGGFRDPEITQETCRCDQVSVSANTRRIEFKSDFVVPMLLLMAVDADGDVGVDDTTLRADGLVQRVTIEYNGEGGVKRRIVDDLSWGTLRAQTAKLARWSADDLVASVGIVVIPLIDPDQPDGLFRASAGSHFSVTFDTASVVEATYTDIIPAVNDAVEILVCKFYASSRQTPRAAATIAESGARATQRRVRNF